MKVEFWGAAQTVTGSMHLVHFQGKRILLDCGLYQGKRSIAFDRNRELPFDARDVDAVILSHAHIDHSGNLPSLIKSGFEGPIYSTSATRDLAAYMLIDSARIQVSDVRYVNKKRAKRGEKPFSPLYETDHAISALNRFRTVEYGFEFQPIPDLPSLSCRFHVAGHMLGAAIVELNLAAAGSEPVRLVFSGDVGRPDMPILRDPESVPGVNYLIMEATYGDRLHPETGDATQTLLEAARSTYEAAGKLIIPAFSVGRTQEIVYRLNSLVEDGLLPPMNVFVDSPLAVNATSVFREHVECFDEEAVQQILSEEDEDPLAFRNLHYIRSSKHSKELNNYNKPCIIISASGMCEAGRILHHLKNSIEKENTTILFAGYQAPHTLGRILLDGSKEKVRIYGQEYQVNARVCRLESSSGHADQRELLEWASGIRDQGDLRKVALVHCELDSAQAFQQLLGEEQIGPVIIPERGQAMELG